MWVYGLDWTGPGQRQVADACECGNEPSGYVKCGEFLDQLQTSQLLKKHSERWSKYVKLVTYNFETAKNYTYLGTIVTKWIKTRNLNKNYRCKQTIFCTSSTTKELFSTQNRKNKNL